MATRKPSDYFSIQYERAIRDADAYAGPDLFKLALDEMGVDSIIDALTNSDKLTFSSDIGVATHYTDQGAKFKAFIYVHESGDLHIWMEALTYNDSEYFDDIMLASADFSWNFMDEDEEVVSLHGQYISRVKELMALRQ